MRITKMGHACVRLESASGTLVIDPGGFSESDAAVGADAVAITHEHFDHFNMDRLKSAVSAKPDLEIYTNPGVASQLGDLGVRVHEVAHGDALRVAGFDVHVYGERHAVIHPEFPTIPNVGFRVEANGSAVFHPGDALTVPEDPVGTLLVPIHAPWSKISEVMDYLREVRPRDAHPVHDGLLNEDGMSVYLTGAPRLATEANLQRLRSGEARDL